MQSQILIQNVQLNQTAVEFSICFTEIRKSWFKNNFNKFAYLINTYYMATWYNLEQLGRKTVMSELSK